MAITFSGLFYVLNGLSMLIIWPVLIATGLVPELSTKFLYMVFHLTAELATAVLGITTGVGLLSKREWVKPLYFLSTGSFLIAGYMACAFYLTSPDNRSMAMASLLFGINLITIALLIPNFIHLYPTATANKAIVLFDGALSYVLINVAGLLFDRGTGYTVSYAGAALLMLGYTLWSGRHIMGQLLKENGV